MSGKFISFEGLDGSGKTTVINKMLHIFKKKLGNSLLITREPGGDHVSEKIREVILDKSCTDMDSRTEALLYAASRRQHIQKIIKPALYNNKVVFCDRFIDSSVAYQGSGRGIGDKDVYDMNLFATEGLLPELTIYLDLDPAVGLNRIKNNRGNQIDRLDLEKLDFYKKVRESYLNLAKVNSDRIKIIDANDNLEEVYNNTEELLINFLHL